MWRRRANMLGQNSHDFDPEDAPDDEEGRFFGGGMGQGTAQAMDYLDQQDEGESAVFP
jgi:beta-catenin-like protein 1